MEADGIDTGVPRRDRIVAACLLANEISSLTSVQMVFNEVCEKAQELVVADRSCLFLVDEKKRELWSLVRSKRKIVVPLEMGIAGHVALTGRAINIGDHCADARFCGGVDKRWNTDSVLALPLKNIDGAVLGVLQMIRGSYRDTSAHCKPRFHRDDELLLQLFLVGTSLAIRSIRRAEHLHSRNAEMEELLSQSSSALNVGDEFDGDVIPILSAPSLEHSHAKHLINARINFEMKTKRLSVGLGTSSRGQHAELLKRWDLNAFTLPSETMITHIIAMYTDLGLLAQFKIPIGEFTNLIKRCKDGYATQNPYHNFRHAFDACHVVYLMLASTDAGTYLGAIDFFVLLTAAIFHDYGHNARNNYFHAITCSDLAIMYNNVSILENFSAASTFRVMQRMGCNILVGLCGSEKKQFRNKLISIILDTDAKQHFVLLTRFSYALQKQTITKTLLCSVLLHAADISNPARPFSLALKWAEAIQEEFFSQGDAERELGLPISPFMNRNDENLPRMQKAFIDSVVSPLFGSLGKMFPSIKRQCCANLKRNRIEWNELDNKNLRRKALQRGAPSVSGGVPAALREDDLMFRQQGLLGGQRNGQSTSSVRPGYRKGGGKGVSGLVAGIGLQKRFVGRRQQNNTMPIQFHATKELKVGTRQDNLSGGRMTPAHKWRPKYIPWYTTTKRGGESWKHFIIRKLESLECQFTVISVLCTFWALFGDDMNRAYLPGSYDSTVHMTSFVVFVLFMIEMAFCIYFQPQYLGFYFYLVSWVKWPHSTMLVCSLSVPNNSILFVSLLPSGFGKYTGISRRPRYF